MNLLSTRSLVSVTLIHSSLRRLCWSGSGNRSNKILISAFSTISSSYHLRSNNHRKTNRNMSTNGDHPFTNSQKPSPSSSKIRYNFWRGHPNHGLLPAEEMQQILQSIAATKDDYNENNYDSDDDDNNDTSVRLRQSLQYLKSDRGDPKLLKAIQEFIEEQTQDDELPEIMNDDNGNIIKESKLDMFLTHGVSHGLDMLCTTQTSPGDLVLVERPTYFLASQIFHSHQLHVESLPMKSNGNKIGEIDIDALQQGLDNGTISIPRMIYIIPTHQNPTGHTMPIEARYQLCQLARKYNILIAADEVYHLLDWRDKDSDIKRPARFAVLDQLVAQSSNTTTAHNNSAKPSFGCSVSINSFTKIFAPGIRCGWIEGPTHIIDSLVDLGYIQSQGGCVPFIGEVLRVALTNGYQQRILQHLIDSYKERCDLMCKILQSEPGIQIQNRPLGGFFIWVDFTDLPQQSTNGDIDDDDDDDAASEFATYCLGRGLKIMPGSRCDSVIENYESSQLPENLCYHSARLCFADMNIKDIEEGCKLLIQYYREYTGKIDSARSSTSNREIIETAARQIIDEGKKVVVLEPIHNQVMPISFRQLDVPVLPNNCLVFPGSFNPPHEGHVALANAAIRTSQRRMKGRHDHYGPTIFFELSLMNADKPAIDPSVVAERVSKFLDLSDLPERWGVVLTSAPLFTEKLVTLQDCILALSDHEGITHYEEAKVNFVIGTDTLVRILNSKYYDNQESKMIESLMGMKGAHFIVGGRLEQDVDTYKSKFVSGEEELKSLPKEMADNLFTIMQESEFRVDISSSEIRRRQQEKQHG